MDTRVTAPDSIGTGIRTGAQYLAHSCSSAAAPTPSPSRPAARTRLHSVLSSCSPTPPPPIRGGARADLFSGRLPL